MERNGPGRLRVRRKTPEALLAECQRAIQLGTLELEGGGDDSADDSEPDDCSGSPSSATLRDDETTERQLCDLFKSRVECPDFLQKLKSAQIIKYAVVSRLFLLGLIMLWRSLLSPYDTSASINPDCLSPSAAIASNPQVLFPRIASALEDSIVWDSVYFVRIAQCGYEYEQAYAFFPLLPICISFLSRTVFTPLIPIIGQRAVLGLSGYVLNNVAFVFAALYLYRLSVHVLKNPEVALLASTLFCFNPASVFYSSIYSESLYALLSIGGAYYLLSGRDNFATLSFALSGAARSNGMINAGYIGFLTMHQAYDAIFRKNNALVVVSGAIRCFCIFIPFFSFQAYGYLNICRGHPEDALRPWCKGSIPLLYDYIQSHYWGVGFLKYFQVKQLPNFLLASPILTLAVCSIVYYVKLWPTVFLSLGFKTSAREELSSSVLQGANSEPTTMVALESKTPSTVQDSLSVKRRKKLFKGSNANNVASQSQDATTEGHSMLPVVILPFILHLAFMAATAFLVMHVQVATRFLSASPSLYWFASYVMIRPGAGKWGHIMWGYCAAYILLGSLLFSNFYPFT